MGERVSQSELARRIGVTRQRINALVKKGRLIVGEDKKLGVEESLEALRVTDDPSQATRMSLGKVEPDKEDESEVRALIAKGKTPTYGDAKTMREIYLARMAKLRYDEARGIVVERNKVESEAFALGRVVRDSLMVIPSRLREVLSATDDPKEVHRLLERELTSVIKELQAMEVGA